MSSVRARDTKPELTVRRAAHAAGMRFRLHQRDLPGCPDLVFPSRRAVVLVHGCFWHQHDDPGCPIRKRAGGSNQAYWQQKLAGNVARDQRHLTELKSLGWRVFITWECQVRSSAFLADFIEALRSVPSKK